MPKTKKETLRKTVFTMVSPNEDARAKLLALSAVVVRVWNQAIPVCQRWLELPKDDPEKKGITPFSLNYWLNEVDKEGAPTDVLRQAMVKLSGSYKSYFELRKNKDTRAWPPREKDEKVYQNRLFTLAWSSFGIQEGGDKTTLLLPIGNRERIPIELDDYLLRRLAELPGKTTKDKIKYVSLSQPPDSDQLKLSLVLAYPTPKMVEDPKRIIAIDLGAGDIAVSAIDGREFMIPARRPDKYWRPEIQALEKRVEKCKKGSRAWKRRMKTRRTMHNKSGAQHTDHQRKVASALCQDVDVIVIGKSKTRLGLAKTVNGTAEQHWGAQNTGYLFRQLIYIKEKAAERGIRVLELPDPKRQGELADPQAKFQASRELLACGCAKFDLLVPKSFAQVEFKVRQ